MAEQVKKNYKTNKKILRLCNSRMLRHSCCEVRVMQLHDILQLRTSVILPEAISDGGLGLDYAERYRNLPYLGILKPEVYS